MSYGTDEDRKAGRIAIGMVMAIVVAGGGWWLWQRARAPAAAVADAAPPTETTVEAPPEPEAIQHPLPADSTPPEQTTLPADPDQAAQAALDEVFGPALAEWLVTEQLARRLVATIDNLPRNTSVEKLRPLQPPATPFAVQRATVDATAGVERIVLDPANFARYDNLVALLARTDAAAAAAAYKRIYPQLQAAYEDLGYPGRYFNDRVVVVIDHLLAAPEPQGELLLEQPKVLYRFADADLEARSTGQKLMLRIGAANARTVKQKLREIRARIAITAPAAGGATNNDNRE
jgi:hypothetical protein